MITADLAALLGADSVVPDEDRARYEHGARYGAGRAAAIVRPRDTGAVQTVMRYAREHAVPLLAQGAHTGLVGAATPDTSGRQIVVSLERLNGIEIRPTDRLAACGAGARLSALNAAGETYGLCLPIDLGADPSLGGMVATNTGGARLIRYGDMRRQVIGLEAVRRDGSLFRDMRGLRKDNMGLDLRQAFVGTGDASGIVTAVMVELQPVNRQVATMLLVPRTIADIPAIVMAFEGRLGSLLSACEGMSRSAVEATLHGVASLRRPFPVLPDYMLLVEASTALPPESGVDVEAELLAAAAMLFEPADGPIIDAIVGKGGEFWALRHAISEGLARRGKVIGLDIAVARSRLPALRDDLIACVTKHFPSLLVADFGHVGDGGVHFNLVAPFDTPDLPALDEAVRSAIYAVLVGDYDGSISAEHGIGPANARFAERFKAR